MVETFRSSPAGQELAVAFIHVIREQRGRVGVSPRDDDGRYIRDIGCQPRSNEVRNRSARWHQHLAAHVSAFLFACELIFEMNTSRAGFDHRFR